MNKNNNQICVNKRLLYLGILAVFLSLGLWIVAKGNLSYNSKAVSPRRTIRYQQVIPTVTPMPPNLSLSFWLSILSRYPDLQKQIKLLEEVVSDPIIRSRIAEVLIANNANLDNLGRMAELYKINRVVGHTLCGDSRVICGDTVFTPLSKVLPQTAYYSLNGGEYPIAIAEQRSLGAAPRVYPRGINISMVSTHCNSVLDPGGCGALAAFDKLLSPEGKEYLLSKGIDQSTITQIENTIGSANPIEQAKLAAKIQAKINYFEHGNVPHITVANQIGHSDRTLIAIAAFDETGREVEIPQVVKDFITINNRGADAGIIDDILAQGQAPFEYVLDATGFNIQDIMGAKAAIPGHTFKITARPQGELPATITSKKIPLIGRIQDVDQAIAGINYPLAHEWGRLQWILGQTQDETALIRERMLLSDPTWKYLGRKGVIVEAVVDSSGKISGKLKITKLADIGGDITAMNVNALKTLGTDTREVVLSSKSLAQLDMNAREAGIVSAETKSSKFIRNLKTTGRVTLKILKGLGPILDGVSGYFTYEWVRDFTSWKITYDLHTQTLNRLYAYKPPVFGITLYNSILSTYSAQPYVITQTYKTVYSRKELANSFMGLLNYYKTEVAGSGLAGTQGNWTTGSTDQKSTFYGVGIGDLYKILVFDYYETESRIQKKLSKEGSPLIFFPIEQPEWWPKETCSNDPQAMTNPNCYPHYDDSKIPNSEIMILNINTGEFLTTDTVGEMIIGVKELSSGTKIIDNNIYYFRLTSDGEGKIFVVPISYKR